MKYLYLLYFFLFCNALNGAQNSKNATFQSFDLTIPDKRSINQGLLCKNNSLSSDGILEYILEYDENNEMGAICNGNSEKLITLPIKKNEVQELFNKKYIDGKTVLSHFKGTDIGPNNSMIDVYAFLTSHRINLYFTKDKESHRIPITIIHTTRYSGPLFSETPNQPSYFPKRFIASLILSTIAIIFIVSKQDTLSNTIKDWLGK